MAPIILSSLSLSRRMHAASDSLIEAAAKSSIGSRLVISCAHANADALDGLTSMLREKPFQLVLCLRLNPAVPSGLTSYALGMSGGAVPFGKYVLASAIGASANVFAYVFGGPSQLALCVHRTRRLTG